MPELVPAIILMVPVGAMEVCVALRRRGPAAANELAPRLEDRCSPYDRSLTCARPGARTTHHTKLDQALARLRKGFKRNEILPGWHVEMVEEKAYSHRDDELGSMALLTLPAVLTLEPLS